MLHEKSYSDAYAHALELENRFQHMFVHSFDDPDVIAGQGTIGLEILHKYQHRIYAVFVAIGGGGRISDVAADIKAVRPEIKVIGVQMCLSEEFCFGAASNSLAN
jgi:threonine dehydratase